MALGGDWSELVIFALAPLFYWHEFATRVNINENGITWR